MAFSRTCAIALTLLLAVSAGACQAKAPTRAPTTKATPKVPLAPLPAPSASPAPSVSLTPGVTAFLRVKGFTPRAGLVYQAARKTLSPDTVTFELVAQPQSPGQIVKAASVSCSWATADGTPVQVTPVDVALAAPVTVAAGTETAEGPSSSVSVKIDPSAFVGVLEGARVVNVLVQFTGPDDHLIAGSDNRLLAGSFNILIQ